MTEERYTPAKKKAPLGRILWPLAIVAAFVIGLMISRGGQTVPEAGMHDHAAESVATTWTCSMHPQIKLPTEGQCPICFMDLIPLETDAGDDLGPRSLVMSENAAALAEIQTSPVMRQEVNPLIGLIGKVNFDETLYKTISAWVPGRIDALFVDYTGAEVQAGQKLVSLYSPELYAAQTELLSAVKASEQLVASKDELMVRTSAATVDAAGQRLRQWGLSQEQVDRIVARGTAADHVDIISPLTGVVVHKDAVEGMYLNTGTRVFTVADLSRVWVSLEAYESDLVYLNEGQSVAFTVAAVPGQSFTGDIIFINPVLNPKTRTAEVRVAVDNSSRRLKPGMFVKAAAQGELPRDENATARGSLVIPATAPLITGKRAVVYVQHLDTEKPTFSGREIVLGPRVGENYVVESGLMEGEMVVTRGNFKIDSALQIQAKPSMMNPTGGGGSSGHDHGAHAGSEMAMAAPPKNNHRDPVTAFDVPAAFGDQLQKVLASSLDLQTALAADDDQVAAKAAAALDKDLDRIDMSLLAGEAHMAWMGDLEILNPVAQKLAQAKDIESRRKQIKPLTEGLWPVLRRYGVGVEEGAKLFHCPMANNDQGADWIQISATTANPYFGSSMLRCGSQVDSLTTGQTPVGR